MTKCFICDQEAHSPYINPPLCARHHDFALIKAITRRTGFPIDVANLKETYQRVRFTPCFPIEDIPALLAETTPIQQEIEFGGSL